MIYIYIFIIGIYIYIYNMYSVYIYILLYKFLDGETVEVNLLFFLTFWQFLEMTWVRSVAGWIQWPKWIVRGARVPRNSPQPSGHRILVIYPMIRPPKANVSGRVQKKSPGRDPTGCKANRRGRCPDLGEFAMGSRMEVFRNGGTP